MSASLGALTFTQIRERFQKDYDPKNKEVKKNARRDKRVFADIVAKEAEEAANKRDMSAIHKITRKQCGTHQKCSTVVNDRGGRILTADSEQATRWVENFKSVLNQHWLASKDLEISVNTLTFRDSGRHQILKNGKATGIDAIHAEMLKVDLLTSVGVFYHYSMRFWNENKYQKIGGRV